MRIGTQMRALASKIQAQACPNGKRSEPKCERSEQNQRMRALASPYFIFKIVRYRALSFRISFAVAMSGSMDSWLQMRPFW